MNRVVVVSGLPASGKSTVARELAAGLASHLLDKDSHLEELFRTVPVVDEQARRSLSLQADAQFQEQARRAGSAVLVSWWKHPRSLVNSGTSTEWLPGLPGAKVEVHCICSPATAAERFLSRKRHPGHLDSRWSYPELVAQFKEQAVLGPLGLGHLIEVETEGTLESEAVLRRVVQAFAEQAL